MRRKTRLLVVCEPMEYGVLSYLERLFEGLDRTRYEPALAYSPHRMAPQAYALVARLTADGVPVRPLAFRRSLGWGDVRAALQLLGEIRRFRPDVLHLHSTKAGVIGRVLGPLAGARILYTAHGTSWHYTGARLGRVQLALERLLRRTTDLLVAVCPEEADAFVAEVRYPRARVRVVPNGVRVPPRGVLTERRHAVRHALGLAPSSVWALFVGRLTREKGLDVLLDALAGDTGLAGCLVVGDGAERATLEAQAMRARVPIRFLGYHADVTPFLAAADVFVQPSRSEGLPFSVLEAMAHGLPVLGTSVGGMAAMLADAGRVVPPAAPAALAAALRALAIDPPLRQMLGAAGRTRIVRDFGASAMLAGLHEVYGAVAAPTVGMVSVPATGAIAP